MQSSRPLLSLDEAISEIDRLKSEVLRLERELAEARKTSGDAAAPPVPVEARALERFAKQIETARQSSPEPRPIGELLNRRMPSIAGGAASEEAATQHLTDLRGAIDRLREERARASVE